VGRKTAGNSELCYEADSRREGGEKSKHIGGGEKAFLVRGEMKEEKESGQYSKEQKHWGELIVDTVR